MAMYVLLCVCRTSRTYGTCKDLVDLSELMLPCRKTNWLI
jgi:hypothetical protein